MTPADLVLHASWVLPVDPQDAVLADHAVVIGDGRILAVLPSDTARQRYDAAREQAFPDHVLLPGFINAHTHAAMVLLRGLADDLPLMTWLQEHIWPRSSAGSARS